MPSAPREFRLLAAALALTLSTTFAGVEPAASQPGASEAAGTVEAEAVPEESPERAPAGAEPSTAAGGPAPGGSEPAGIAEPDASEPGVTAESGAPIQPEPPPGRAIVEPPGNEAATTAPARPEALALAPLVERGMALWNTPGAAVAVVGPESILFQQGFGQTEYPDGQPIDEHTLFAIASTTKAMIAAAILILADEGRLTLDDPVVKHVPELHFSSPLLTAQVTVRDLLAHRTGLPPTDFWTFFQEMSLDEQIQRLAALEPEAGLRSKLIYQNTMYGLAGLVIERVSGKRWDILLNDWLWQPIGMHETFASRGQIRGGRVRVSPHYYLNEELTVAPWDLPADYLDAAGSVWSSLHDMSLWAQFLLRGGVTAGGRRLISAEAFVEMFEPQQLVDAETFYPVAELTQPNWRSYSLGWFQQDFQGRKIDYHTGSLSGLIALLGLDRQRARAVIVLGNRDHAEFRHALFWEVMDDTQGEARRDWNQAVFDVYQRRAAEREAEWSETRQKRLSSANPGLPWDAYIGVYSSAVKGDIVVGRSDNKLELRTARITLEMWHWHLDTFLVEYDPWQIREFATFRIGTEGGVTELEVFGDRFKRLDREPPSRR